VWASWPIAVAITAPRFAPPDHQPDQSSRETAFRRSFGLCRYHLVDRPRDRRDKGPKTCFQVLRPLLLYFELSRIDAN
jgi:hypothetical protein